MEPIERKTVSLTSRQLLASMHYIFIIEDWMIAIFTIQIHLLQLYTTRVNMRAETREKENTSRWRRYLQSGKWNVDQEKRLKKQKALERVKVYDFLVGFRREECHTWLSTPENCLGSFILRLTAKFFKFLGWELANPLNPTLKLVEQHLKRCDVTH